MIRYTPENEPTEVGLLGWLGRQFREISAAINNIAGGTREVFHTAPEKPSEGQIVYADGTDWNPGNGSGYYWYDTALSAWRFMGVADFYFDVALGRIPGSTSKNVVAHSSVIDTNIKTVWAQPALYTYSTTADIDQISSSNASDTHVITLIGLDINWVEVTQLVTLNGQTPVTLTTPLFRINTVINLTGTITLGNVYVWVAGGGATAGVPNTIADIRSQIILLGTISNEVSTSSVVSIPAGKTGALAFGKTSATTNKAVEFTWWARAAGGVFHIAHHVDFKDTNYDYFFKVPGVVQEKTDLEARASVDVATAEVSAAYDLVLVDNPV